MEMKTLTVNGQTYTVADPDAAHIDDSAVSDKAWSGKNIIDRLCPAFAVSGTEVACQPVEGYPLEVVSHIAATQDGVAQVTLRHSGKNLFDISKVLGAINIGDGSLKISRRGQQANAPNTLRDYAPGLQAGKTYTLSADCTHTGNYIYLVGYNKSWAFGKSLTVTEEILDSTVLWYNSTDTTGEDATPNIITNIQIEPGSGATAYEPYSREEKAVGFGKTVYGGSYNWNTGVLTDENGQTTQLEPWIVLARSGVNMLCSSTGDTGVTGRADPGAVMEKLTNAIIALGGNI